MLAGLLSTTGVNAQENDFFTDSSLLKPWKKGTFDRAYLNPNILKLMKRHNAILIDQPEIFIADDSKYKGAKGDQLKQLSDTARLAMMERLSSGGYRVADEPGPDVMYLRWAISDLYLKKKKRSILSYTAMGMVVHTTKQAMIKDLFKKIDIVELGLQVEISDGSSGEIIAAAASKQGTRKSKGQKEDLVTWEELDAMFSTVGERTRCYLDNAGQEENERADCDSIVIEPMVAETM
jgi:hypothetical protein